MARKVSHWVLRDDEGKLFGGIRMGDDGQYKLIWFDHVDQALRFKTKDKAERCAFRRNLMVEPEAVFATPRIRYWVLREVDSGRYFAGFRVGVTGEEEHRTMQYPRQAHKFTSRERALGSIAHESRLYTYAPVAVR